MIGVRLYLAQRLSALIMAPLIVAHIATMIYAVQNGLTASEILSRTQASAFWGIFYGLFVAAVSVHGAIGLRAVLHEWFGVAGRQLDVTTWCFGIALALLGGRAIAAVVL